MVKKIHTLKISTLIAVGLWAAFGAFAQLKTDSVYFNSVNRSTLLGVGKVSLTDTYLSPLEYDGLSLSILHERFKKVHLFSEKLVLNQQFQLQIATTQNPSHTASEHFGELSYHIVGLYPFIRNQKFRLSAGSGLAFSLGGIYNNRNSNNPGSLKTSLNLQLSALASYQWRAVTLRWQLSTPLAGAFFSPEYRHSYYEIFTLGNKEGTVHFASLHNQWALKNYLTVDIPIKNITFRTGYLGHYYKTNQNRLITIIASHQLMLGIAAESLSLGGNSVRKNQSWLKSAFY